MMYLDSDYVVGAPACGKPMVFLSDVPLDLQFNA